MQEYKRTCRSCGKVWHSLTSREKEIQSTIGNQACLQCCDASAGDHAACAQRKRNQQAGQDSLDNLRRCPNCGSQSYNETIVNH